MINLSPLFLEGSSFRITCFVCCILLCGCGPGVANPPMARMPAPEITILDPPEASKVRFKDGKLDFIAEVRVSKDSQVPSVFGELIRAKIRTQTQTVAIEKIGDSDNKCLYRVTLRISSNASVVGTGKNELIVHATSDSSKKFRRGETYIQAGMAASEPRHFTITSMR